MKGSSILKWACSHWHREAWRLTALTNERSHKKTWNLPTSYKRQHRSSHMTSLSLTTIRAATTANSRASTTHAATCSNTRSARAVPLMLRHRLISKEAKAQRYSCLRWGTRKFSTQASWAPRLARSTLMKTKSCTQLMVANATAICSMDPPSLKVPRSSSRWVSFSSTWITLRLCKGQHSLNNCSAIRIKIASTARRMILQDTATTCRHRSEVIKRWARRQFKSRLKSSHHEVNFSNFIWEQN